MSTPAKPDPNAVSLLIAGKVHSQWSSYEIDSDLITPADAWQVGLGLSQGQLPPIVTEGASVQVKVGEDIVLTGTIDDIRDTVSPGQHSLQISGRDGAAMLVDCSAPIFSSKQLGLAEIIANIVRPLGIHKIRLETECRRSHDKVSIDPGDTAWDALKKVAEANGLWPWFEPDGTLVVGGPDYCAPPVATLIMRRDGKGNNLLSLERTRSMAGRYSEITVLGQGHGTRQQGGQNALKSTVKDSGVPLHRPRTVIDPDADNLEFALAKGRKLLADSRLQGFTLNALVHGHRTSDGLLWEPGQRIHVISEPHELDGIYFLMSRKLQGGVGQGTRTQLTLKEDGAWVLDARPSQFKKPSRRGPSASAKAQLG